MKYVKFDENEIWNEIFGEKQPKKKRTSQEVEIQKNKIKEDRLQYHYLMIDDLDGLHSEIYNLIYNYDILNLEYNLKALDEIYQKEDIELLEAIRKDCKELIQIHKNSIVSNEEIISYKSIEKIVYKSFEKLKLYSSKQAIIKFLKRDDDKIQNILNEIKTYDESDIIYESLINSEHIVILDKSYSIVKKAKQRKRKTKQTNLKKYLFIPITYEQALRRNRHILECDLKEIGVGQQRASRISSILQYLK